MQIPEGLGWKQIKERLAQLNVESIDHISFGFPKETSKHNETQIRDFYDGMTEILSIEKAKVNNDTEKFFYPKENKLGYEHLLWPRNETFFHIEIDCSNSTEEILKVFPEAFEEQPGMFWLTVDKDFLGILWAVILSNKKFSL